MKPIFHVEGNRVLTSPHAAGPWGPMQHGSAPAALVTWAAEAIATPVPMHVARITIDLMRPVPVAPLTIATEMLREGRKIQLCAVRLLADGVVVVSANVLKVKVQPASPPAGTGDRPLDLPGPDQSIEETGTHGASPFTQCVSIRAARGRFGVVGPGAIWFRVNGQLIDGAPLSQAVRAAVASDFSNAVSPALDFRKWIFINADLTISMARQPVGEWILLDGECSIGPDGAGLATSRLADQSGYFGRAVQSLVVEKR